MCPSRSADANVRHTPCCLMAHAEHVGLFTTQRVTEEHRDIWVRTPKDSTKSVCACAIST